MKHTKIHTQTYKSPIGELVGYAGRLPVKKKLLELERNLFTA